MERSQQVLLNDISSNHQRLIHFVKIKIPRLHRKTSRQTMSHRQDGVILRTAWLHGEIDVEEN